MTYRELLTQLEDMEEDQLSYDVMALVDGEYYRVVELRVQDDKEDDRLDDGHPYIIVE